MKQREVNDRTLAVIEAARENSAVRTPRDMMEFVQDGAADIATLTVIARGHQFEFGPAMEALERLAKLADWDHPFIVANRTPGGRASVEFRWQDSPVKRFKGFADFYAQELEPAWGNWEDLLRTWKKVSSGELTEAEGKNLILGPREIGIVGGKPGPGRGHKTDDNVNRFMGGNDPSYIAARIKRDHPEIAAAVERGEFKSMRAAGIAAGFIHPLTPYQEMHRAWKKASEDDRRCFLEDIKKENYQ